MRVEVLDPLRVLGLGLALAIAAPACSLNRWTGALPEHASKLCEEPTNPPTTDTLVAVAFAGATGISSYAATLTYRGDYCALVGGACPDNRAPNVLATIGAVVSGIATVLYGLSAAYGYRRAGECKARKNAPAVVVPKPPAQGAPLAPAR